MSIPLKVKLLTPTAKAPQRANEGGLWDLFADSFSIMELEDFKGSEKDFGACLNKTIKENLTNNNYIVNLNKNEIQYNEEISFFKIFASEICDYEIKPNIIKGFKLYPQGRVFVKTGIALKLPVKSKDNDIIAYAVADLIPLSGLALKHGITILNSPSTIDNSYRKEIGIILYNAGHEPYEIKKGDKICRMLVKPLYPSTMQIVSEIKDI
jgi:deoxyuridine 5'-triphosphate nucleotidohydrolase